MTPREFRDHLDSTRQSVHAWPLPEYHKQIVLHLIGNARQHAKLCEKLPRYADTGKLFVPGRDDAWCVGLSANDQQIVIRVWSGEYYPDSGQWAWRTTVGAGLRFAPAYSSISAAQDAMQRE